MARLETACARVGYPKSIRVDQGSEFVSRGLDLWAYAHGVTLGIGTVEIEAALTRAGGVLEQAQGTHDQALAEATEQDAALRSCRRRKQVW